MSEQTMSDTELTALFAADIPCEGIQYEPVARTCDRAADVRSSGHGCAASVGTKCFQCWNVWYRAVAETMTEFGEIGCGGCDLTFTTISAYSEYRRF